MFTFNFVSHDESDTNTNVIALMYTQFITFQV
jgi:hypothetical protein